MGSAGRCVRADGGVSWVEKVSTVPDSITGIEGEPVCLQVHVSYYFLN